jgi:hypothetical protein
VHERSTASLVSTRHGLADRGRQRAVDYPDADYAYFPDSHTRGNSVAGTVAIAH